MNDNSNRTINDLSHDDKVESRAREIFRGACEGADSYHVLRLGAARRKALAARNERARARTWAPAAGAIACCALVVAGIAWMQVAPRATSSPVAASPTRTATSPADNTDDIPEVGTTQMEMVQNLDFYRWLASQPSVASVPAGSGSE